MNTQNIREDGSSSPRPSSGHSIMNTQNIREDGSLLSRLLREMSEEQTNELLLKVTPQERTELLGKFKSIPKDLGEKLLDEEERMEQKYRATYGNGVMLFGRSSDWTPAQKEYATSAPFFSTKTEQRLTSVRRHLARQTDIHPHILRRIAQSVNMSLRRLVAGNPSAPFVLLEDLSRDQEAKVRQEVARNPSTHTKLLERLSSDHKRSVRASVAENEHTPRELLCQLAKDKDGLVRQKVAGNPNTPMEVVQQLLDDSHPLVVIAAGMAEQKRTRQARQTVSKQETAPQQSVKSPESTRRLLVRAVKSEVVKRANQLLGSGWQKKPAIMLSKTQKSEQQEATSKGLKL